MMAGGTEECRHENLDSEGNCQSCYHWIGRLVSEAQDCSFSGYTLRKIGSSSQARTLLTQIDLTERVKVEALKNLEEISSTLAPNINHKYVAFIAIYLALPTCNEIVQPERIKSLLSMTDTEVSKAMRQLQLRSKINANLVIISPVKYLADCLSHLDLSQDYLPAVTALAEKLIRQNKRLLEFKPHFMASAIVYYFAITNGHNGDNFKISEVARRFNMVDGTFRKYYNQIIATVSGKNPL